MQVIFATSFGYGDGVLAAAERYPDIIFAHATGIQRAPNVMTYIADFYQVYYLNGLIAGALTESNKIGYVAAFPIPEVKRHINGFALGPARSIPKRSSRYGGYSVGSIRPAPRRRPRRSSLRGPNVFAFTEDTPTVIQTAAERGFPSYSHYASMYEFSPDTVVSGQIVNWEAIYIRLPPGRS